MRPTLTSITATLVLALAGLSAGQARAEWREPVAAASVPTPGYVDHAVRPLQGSGRRGRDRQAPQVRVSLDQAVNMVERRYGGEVIGARTERNGDRVTHRIKVLKQGKVRTYRVDGTTGAIR